MSRLHRALVTGAGGFVGTHLCDALVSAGWETHGTLRPGGTRWRLPGLPKEARLCEADLRDFAATHELLKQIRPDIVFNAVAHNPYRPTSMRVAVAADILTLANLLDATDETGCERFVHLGGSLEYGPSETPHREGDALRPVSLRGSVKAGASLLAAQQGDSGGRPIVVLRLFSVYGPWEAPHRLVPSAIRAALADEELPITPPGFTHDFVFAPDVAEACLRAAVAPNLDGEIINVAGGHPVTNEELVETVARVVGRPVSVREGAFPSRPWDRRKWVADIRRSRELLGWSPRHALDEGIRKTIEWTRAFSGVST
jgi:nucleoside-diphosphate-sugar epimerase